MNASLSESAVKLSTQRVAQDFGPPQERLARVAARRAFVEMKQSYMDAVSDIDSGAAELLRHKVRKASESWELWSLRAVILASLRVDHERTLGHRMKLERDFDIIFGSAGQ